MNRQLIQMIFEAWLQQKHPMYYYITGTCFWLSILGGIFSIICIWLMPEIWWKIGLSVAGFFLLNKIVAHVFMNYYFEEFKSGKDKLIL